MIFGMAWGEGEGLLRMLATLGVLERIKLLTLVNGPFGLLFELVYIHFDNIHQELRNLLVEGMFW